MTMNKPLRSVILHNHLFKNAGTSVDHILRDNYAGRWVSREFTSLGQDNTADLAKWISEDQDAVAFSTHTMLGPIPVLEGVEIIPVTMLRDPVERIASAYRFERVQKADTFGTRLARQNGFAGYVHARLSINGDRQCRNFQTNRMSILSPTTPGRDLDRAMHSLREISRTGVLGIVSDFAAAMDRLKAIVSRRVGSFDWKPVVANATGQQSAHAISPDMRQLLLETNADDLSLFQYAQRLSEQSVAPEQMYRLAAV
ncbi:hypothetical protein Z946_1735 [Sulfitobacter noctilucicola]|uniref:Sulfotransferase family protein n=1 Tax=Sulfitobacter noctilucicola TaxID=1342301 RepID=A0A7W6Q2J1_9RHOB|nr:sulfotransferase family 2 domain-containing protein [Sulfitobacter noctilucicola]KIN62872.1 hypothetical protein Z946_1735 [Sulfitobacter noctilucicola]MBB4172598.1 hypothetical protein [Sulfitobacter noctilucicola]